MTKYSYYETYSWLNIFQCSAQVEKSQKMLPHRISIKAEIRPLNSF